MKPTEPKSIKKFETHTEDIDPRKIVTPGFSPREKLDPSHVSEIASSFINDGGQKDNILITYRNEKPTLIDGGHEIQAAINNQMKKVRVTVFDDISDDDALALAIRFNFLKKPFNDLELARALKKLRDAHWSVKDITTQLPLRHQNQAFVYATLSLLDLAPEIQKEIERPGTLMKNAKVELTQSHLRTIATLPVDTQLEVVKLVLEKGMGVQDTLNLVQDKKDELFAGVTGDTVKIIQNAVKEGKTIQNFGKDVQPVKGNHNSLINVTGLRFYRLLRDCNSGLSFINPVLAPKQDLATAMKKDLKKIDTA